MEPEMSPNSRRGRSASNALHVIEAIPEEPTVKEQPAARDLAVNEEPRADAAEAVPVGPGAVSSKLSIGFRMENLLRPDVVEVQPSAPPEAAPKTEVTPKSRNRRKGNPKKIVEVKSDELDDLSDLDETLTRPAAIIGKLTLNALQTNPGLGRQE